MPYRAPLSEFRFLFDHVVGFRQVRATERFSEATEDLTDALLSEVGRVCADVIAPLQRVGDCHPARLENGVVRTSPGFADGYRAIADGGWIGMSADPENGGLGLPMTVTTAVNEMLSSACLSLQLSPLMTQGQIEALEHHGDDAMKALYLPKLVSGEWCGTMNLTEPQAGSDVGALVTKAEPAGDGTYRITGQKIYITWGDNDFTENVCHLVLARLPDGAPGTRGISLFLVPKLVPNESGNPGERNSLRVVSLEHKLGLHASPTAVMQYDNAIGWLVGEPHDGMAAMFTMMNNARLGVGVQGVGVAEAAYQQALAFAMERRQGRADGLGTIVEHADVRRMLATMKAEIFAARAIAFSCAVAIDMGRATETPEWKTRAALLTPIAKAWGTEIGNAVAHEGIQVHGGMGFIEETGAAQFARDIRVATIYEGTNGIQAMDLVGRKLTDDGEAVFRLLDEIQGAAETARGSHPDLAKSVWNAAETLRETTEWLVDAKMPDRNSGAVPYLAAFARVLGAHYHLAAALSGDPARAAMATVFVQRLLPEFAARCAEAKSGAAALFALSSADLAA